MNRKHSKTRFVVFSTFAVVILACGGSGPTAYNFTSTKLRAYKVGDYYEYRYTIPNTNPVTDLTQTFGFQLAGSQPQIQFREFPTGSPSTPYTVEHYKFSQDATGVHFTTYGSLAHMYDWPDDSFVSWQASLPGPWFLQIPDRPIAGPLFPLRRSIPNHSNMEMTPVGVESVTVPAGTFSAEKSTIIYYDIGPDPIRQTTIWFVPSISAAVRVYDEYFDGRPPQIVELESYTIF